jgi:hypothetical protein
MRDSQWCLNHDPERAEENRRRQTGTRRHVGRLAREEVLGKGWGAVNAWQLLPAIRDLYSCLRVIHLLQLWELQSRLYCLNYTDDLADEAEIAAAVEVARTDWSQWRAA